MANQSTDTRKYLIDKAINDVKKIKLPFRIGQFLLILAGFVLVFLGSVDILWAGAPISNTAKPILESIGQALIVGPAISVFIDLPFMQTYYRNRIVDVLVGNEYLSSLPDEELEKLRKDCTERIYLKKTKHFEPTLLELDEKITKLLSQAYVSTYRSDVSCKKMDDGNIKKNVTIKFWLENPIGDDLKEKFDFSILLYSIDGVDKDKLFQFKKFRIRADNGKEENYLEHIELVYSETNELNMSYNSCVSFKDKRTKLPIEVSFQKSLEVEIEDERIVPPTDNIFIKRILRPTKNFQIHYHVNNVDAKLEGACFGTMPDSALGQVHIVKNEKSISIESFNWLLPGNGILIATIPGK